MRKKDDDDLLLYTDTSYYIIVIYSLSQEFLRHFSEPELHIINFHFCIYIYSNFINHSYNNISLIMNLSTYPPTSSPTDKILSPSSRTIWVQSKKEQYDTIFRNADRDVQESEASSSSAYPITLQNQLKPVQFPGNGKRFILGTSSSSRKKIIDALNWNYTQMSPDIDG